MASKNITMTLDEYTVAIEAAYTRGFNAARSATVVTPKPAAEVKATPAPKPAVVITPELKARVLEAVKADPKKTPGKDGTGQYHKTFAAFLIAQAVKKYGNADGCKAETILAAAKGYNLA